MNRAIAICFLLLAYSIGHAQLDVKITSGVVACDQGDLDKAIDALTTGLSDIKQLKEKNISKGYFYRGKAYSQRWSRNRMKQIPFDDYDLIRAANDFQACLKNDRNNDYTKQVNAQYNLLRSNLLGIGLNQMNLARNQDAEKFLGLTKSSMEYLNTAKSIRPDYMVYDLLGQNYLALGDSSTALDNFDSSIHLFEQQPPSTPDLLIAYAYYRKALIHRYGGIVADPIGAALEDLAAGKNTLNREHQRLRDKRENFTEDEWNKLEQQYSDASNDLSSFELDCLLNDPSRSALAIEQFDMAVKLYPKDYLKHVAYAQLLEQIDPDKSAEIYLKAIEIDPNRTLALFNLGALYTNMAVPFLKASNQELDATKAEETRQKGEAYLIKSRKYLEEVVRIEPCEEQALNALVQICLNTDEAKGYQMFTQLQKDCGHK